MKRKYNMKFAGLIRIGLVILLALVQIAVFVLLTGYLQRHATLIFIILEAVALVVALFLVDRDRNPTYTIGWVTLILLVPVLGMSLYLLWGQNRKFHTLQKQLAKVDARLAPLIHHDDELLQTIDRQLHPRRNFIHFLKTKGFPVYLNTTCTYFTSGEAQFERMLADIAAARQFVFLETFILSEGDLWQRFEELLIKKAAEGVEIRLLYDDFGSVAKAPSTLLNDLRANGIQVYNFNPVLRYTSRLYINYRNHQKITVIDGHIGYTGGTNLADEYANIYSRFGHWKDTAIRLEGDAVWGMTTTFLMMWELETGEGSPNYARYRPEPHPEAPGFAAPYWDGPVRNPDNPAENLYRQMIATAQDYLYVSTPYLVVDYSLLESLCTVAASGVDVRIVTPGTADRWYVHAVTQSNYRKLLENGVRVYEYKPGYIHAKTMLADGDHAITGSINLDFRSFNLHFENAVWLADMPVLEDIRQDFMDIFAVSEEIQLADWRKLSRWRRVMQATLKIFSPMF